MMTVTNMYTPEKMAVRLKKPKLPDQIQTADELKNNQVLQTANQIKRPKKVYTPQTPEITKALLNG